MTNKLRIVTSYNASSTSIMMPYYKNTHQIVNNTPLNYNMSQTDTDNTLESNISVSNVTIAGNDNPYDIIYFFNNDLERAVIHTCLYKYYDTMKFIIEHYNVELVNTRDSLEGYTTLICVCTIMYGDEVNEEYIMSQCKMIRYLIERGVDIDATDPQYKRTALMYAVSMCDIRVIECLLQCGADVNVDDDIGNSALMHAIQYKRDIDVIQLLLNYGADADDENEDGVTILMNAAYYECDSDIIKLLEQHIN